MVTAAILDFERLLAPIAGSNPAGTDLRADDTHGARYWTIQSSWSLSKRIERKCWADPGKPDNVRTFDEVLANRQWSQVIEQSCQALSEQSKDLEIAAWLCEALVREHGYAGLKDGIRLARLLVEQFWDSLYPVLDRQTPATLLEGIENRIRRFQPFFDKSQLLPLRQVPITRGPVGNEEYSDFDYEQAKAIEGLADPKERESRATQFKVNLQKITQRATDTPAPFFQSLVDDLQGCLGELEQFANVLNERCKSAPGAEQVVPSPRDVINTLKGVLATVSMLAGDKLAAAIPRQEDGLPGPDLAPQEGVGAGTTSNPVAKRALLTRDMAFQQLQELANYFRKTEPHSPIAPHLEEAIRWGQLPLMDLLAELIPEKQVLSNLFTRIGFSSLEKDSK